MARLLFEIQGIRGRRGSLATGIEYVVYSDSAGTVPADISATSGVSATSSATVDTTTSTVTTADIAGLGPAALRFYGPDGIDNLYLGVPSDPSLGVQELEAATDERLDVLEAGGGGSHPNLATHDALGLATDAELATHAADTTAVHGIADTSVLATTSGVASSIITHAAAVDPHADRAYARAYADSVAQGLDVKLSVRVASTANLTLSGEQTIDGVLTSADRVLVKNQTAGAANGIYVSAAGAWSRATDADISAELSPGSFTFVEEGTVNGGTGWVQATPDPVILDTTALVFTQFSGGGTIIGGAGLLKTGSTLDVGAGTGITVAADTVGIASGGVTNTQVSASAGIAESKLALNFPTHATDHAARHAAAGADPLTGYVLTGDHTAAAHDTLGLATDAELTTHAADTTAVHGITDTTALVKVSEGPVLASRYGADPANSAAANQTALQNFITAVVLNGWDGLINVPGVYQLSARLDFSRRPSWSVKGLGRGSTVLKQTTDNTPIFYLGSDTASLMHTWEISGLTFDYTNSQPSTNTAALPIAFNCMAFEGKLVDCIFAKGYYAIRITAAVEAPWGCTWDNLIFQSGLTGGAFDWSSGLTGTPNNYWGRMLVDANNMVGPVFALRCLNSYMAATEILSAAQGPVLLLLAAGSELNIGAIKLENGSYTSGSNKRLFDFEPNCDVQINQLVIEGTPITITPSGGAGVYLIRHQGGTSGGLRIGYLRANATTLSGAVHVADAARPLTIDSLVMTNGWTLQNNGSTAAAEFITVRDWVNGRISQDKGNADYTVTLGDPNIAVFNTAFTAPRTVNLPNPTSGNDLHNGLWYECVFSGAINGANTAVIKAGATTLATLTADGIARFTWRRHTTAPSGWVRTK